MAEGTERYVRSFDVTSVLVVLWRWVHVPALLTAIGFMFWVRAQSYEDFIRSDGAVRLTAVDSWYHWRTTMYTVRNWPATMPYDPWTAYPTGTYVGQFGTLFDQIVATVALVVGRGSPDTATVFTVALLAVPAIAALVAIPVYYLGRRLGGRLGGLIAVGLLALFPGRFMTKSTAGMFQHHAAEVLFMAVAVLATMVALRVAERERPGGRGLHHRDVGELRRPLGYSALAGVAVALYLWVWPPGVVLIGILGCFFAVELTVEYVRGQEPEHVAFVGAVALTVTGILATMSLEVMTVHPTADGPLQPGLAFAVAGGCVFMAWLARAWDDHVFDERLYPVAIVAIAVVGAGAVAVLLPGVWETMLRAVYGRLIPAGFTSTALTVPEAQPPEDVPQFFFRQYGAAFYTAMVGLGALVLRSAVEGDHRAEHALVVVWALMLTSMAVTQIRFNYYYVLPVAALNAYLVGQIARGVTLTRFPRLRAVDVGRTLAFLAVAVILVASLLPPVASVTVVEAGEDQSPSRDAMRWKSSNEWLQDNSPAPGDWGGAGNADQFDYYGTYQVPSDGDFAYPEGAYGVLSWWHYGHIITVQAKRIPHANPFQDNALSSAAFFTAASERRAELVLESLPAAGNATDRNQLKDDELAAVADERTAQQATEEFRYVMIDDEMAGEKFDGMATYADTDPGAYWEYREIDVVESESTVNGTVTAPVRNDAYEETVLSRLYFDDADGMEHYRLVHDDNQRSQFASVAVSRDGGQRWQPHFVNRPVTSGFLDELNRLRDDPDVDVAVYDVRQEPAVKIYERVEGAELAGTVDAPAGTTVTASLELTARQFGRTFTYTQTATVGQDGEFSMTVPYATEADASVEDGYTDSDVVANGNYVISVDGEPIGVAQVPESALYDGGSGDVSLVPNSFTRSRPTVPSVAPSPGVP